MDIENLEEKEALLKKCFFPTKDVKYTKIEDYVLKTLDIDSITTVKPDVFHRNFIHLMCNVIKDIKEIEDRLKRYRNEHDSLKNKNGLEVEYQRRKIQYFCKINKEAYREICYFLSDGVAKYLLDTSYDVLKREDENDSLADLQQCRRYKYALHKKYFSYEFPFDAAVKIERYIRSKYELKDWLSEERKMMDLFFDDPDKFWTTLYYYVDNENIMDTIKKIVQHNYHLSKRREIFETLYNLLSKQKYQSFTTLGLIQIEGLFDDYCCIKFGDHNNQGTLIEKAQKSLEDNEFLFYKMYPYFAFDIPRLRNEVAHTGMIKTDDAKKIAYNLILDLHTISYIVHSESSNKFSTVKVLYDELLELESTEIKKEDFFDMFTHKLFMFDKISNEHFWNILRDPTTYKDELQFYKKEDIEKGYIDLPGIVDYLSEMIKSDGFWCALQRLIKKYCNKSTCWSDLEEFAKRMKNQYIAILDGNAKKECIEVARIVG